MTGARKGGDGPPKNAADCQSCGARILWITLINRDGSRKRHPVDAAGIVQRVVLNGDRTEGAVRWVAVSHFATCPNAGAHRKSGSAKPDAVDFGDGGP